MNYRKLKSLAGAKVLLWISFVCPHFGCGGVPIVGDFGRGFRKSEVVDRTLTLRSGGTLALTNVNGEISVRSWNREEVRILATKQAEGHTLDDAKKRLASTEIIISEGEGRIDVRTEPPEEGGDRGGQSVDYELTVPRKIDLELASRNGDIQVRSVEGAVSVEMTNGSIRIEDVQGAISAGTTNGDIDFEAVQGPVLTRSVNGDIEMELLTVGTDDKWVEARCTNGGIRLVLPKGTKARLKAQTTTGDIETDFPVPVSARGVIGESIEGDVNGGGGGISLETVNGDIRLVEIQE